MENIETIRTNLWYHSASRAQQTFTIHMKTRLFQCKLFEIIDSRVAMKFMKFFVIFFYIQCKSHLIPSIFSCNKFSLIKRICAMKYSSNKFKLEMIFHRYFFKSASLVFVYFDPQVYITQQIK